MITITTPLDEVKVEVLVAVKVVVVCDVAVGSVEANPELLLPNPAEVYICSICIKCAITNRSDGVAVRLVRAASEVAMASFTFTSPIIALANLVLYPAATSLLTAS